MKILAFSDPHVGGHTKFGKEFGFELFGKVKRVAEKEKPDIVVCLGDLVDPDALNMTIALELFQQIPCEHKLMVAGNNDIEQIIRTHKFSEHIQLIAMLAKRFGVTLLDAGPFTLGDYAFVGNFGFYDLSLWEPSIHPSDKYPKTKDALIANAKKIHMDNFGLTVAEVFEGYQEALRSGLKQVAGKKIVLCTHTVPTPDMLLYGHSAKYDFQNAWMGFDDSKSADPLINTPGLQMWLCGHDHRNHRIEKKVPMINVSGREQPHIFEI